MRHTAAIVLIMSLPFAAAMADVYRSVDAQGHVQYSDTPTPGAELIHMQKQGIPGGTSTPSNTSTAKPQSSLVSTAQALAKSDAKVADELGQQAAQRAVQQDLEQTRADQCKKATDDYQASLAARRIYRTGPNGERDYLTDDEAEQQRVSLRQAMQSACGS